MRRLLVTLSACHLVIRDERRAAPRAAAKWWRGRSGRRALLLLVILFLATPALALDKSRTLTQYAHRIWQAQQGLPQATIYSVHQSKDGYLWLGTLTGPVRFDGVRFTRMIQFGEISLADVPILDIAEGSTGDLYFATDGQGVIRLHNNAATRFLPKQRVQKILIDSGGAVYGATAAGLLRFEASDEQFHPIENLPLDLRAVCETADHRVAAAGANNRITFIEKGSGVVSRDL